ncbi:MAG: AAA family ATPase [Paludibacteraceae bacterium]|nr:AAA family ATPase [Paludibacteraceae bacterium]
MNTLLFGRENESRLIQQYIESERSEFVAVYGRRRVGKTFLLREALKDRICFSFTGLANSTGTEQLLNFNLTLRQQMPQAQMSGNWQEAFVQLELFLETVESEKKVILFDELPWIDTPKSHFLPAFEHFWNAWASTRQDIKLFVCGSAASWMLDNVINSHGGLHNRITHEMLIQPFTLKECREYFSAMHFGYSDKEVADFYMAFDGIPYYMSLMDKKQSVAQNIDRLFFAPTGELRNEKDNLFRSLFLHSDDYVAIIDSLSAKGKGLTRAEILQATKLNNNALFGKRLDELEKCGFIRRFEDYNGLRRQTIFQLTDPLCHFIHSVVEKNKYHDPDFWLHSQLSPLFNTWSGLAFEMLCLNHIEQIKRALGISGIQTKVYSWRTPKDAERQAQIDMVIDRADRAVNICEMKYSRQEYEMTRQERERIENRLNQFMKYAEQRKSLRLTMVTSYGLKPNSHISIVQNEITLSDLMQ